jgi:hypothetical protein
MSNCGNCGEHKNTPESVPYIVHEASMARMERQIKRLWIALIVLVAVLFATNIGWLVYESQFDTFEYSYDYEQDGQGTNIIGNGNDVINGAETEDKN